MSSSSPSLLVVDDDEDTCQCLSDIFSDLGYRVETCLNGQKAIERANKGCFDAALLDLRMPGMDGLELFQQLHDLCPHTKAVLITGEVADPRTDACLRAGMFRIFSKPLDVSRLVTFVSQIVS